MEKARREPCLVEKLPQIILQRVAAGRHSSRYASGLAVVRTLGRERQPLLVGIHPALGAWLGGKRSSTGCEYREPLPGRSDRPRRDLSGKMPHHRSEEPVAPRLSWRVSRALRQECRWC